MDAHVAEALAAVVRTTCPYCGVGCGVIARPDGLDGAAIEGDPEHPSNFGRLCSKGSALGETLGLDGRLLHPMIDGRRASWDAAQLARLPSIIGCRSRPSSPSVSPSADPFEHSRPKFDGCSGSPSIAAPSSPSGRAITPQPTPQYGQVVRTTAASASATWASIAQ